jgi:2-phosphosulfolactate phosphatase
MSHQLHVHLLPSLIEADALNGGTAVIIDILRASSTMITAMQNGAKRVIPCGTTEEAFRLREQSPNESIILGGERGGVKIQGFDFGNSPAEYSTAAVAGRTVVFTTTNGTKAILKASPAATILIGAFLNRAVIADRLLQEQRDTHLICAGTDGIVTGEDVLFAGAIVDELIANDASESEVSRRWVLNDSAVMAWSLWRKKVTDVAQGGTDPANQHGTVCERLALAMRDTQGGRNLVSLGYDSDIGLCSQLDQFRIIPKLDRQKNCLTAE